MQYKIVGRREFAPEVLFAFALRVDEPVLWALAPLAVVRAILCLTRLPLH